ncbi:M23 family metallopeptidase [Hydrogenophaga electricum]|uniref:M23 family metallopeptidase n=1 Tax=Hydrogenophaga electricum TaxID=1230953 RepID=UPI0024E0590C|nr:M23 family metallopeptidase [Hydrogenophaga electricum]
MPLLSGMAQASAQLLSRHPRRVAAGLGVLLLGTGVTAFGIAPLAPDAADLPVTRIVEAVPFAPLSPDALGPALPFTLYRSEAVRRDDTPQSLLQRLGVQDPAALAYLRNDPAMRDLFGARTGKLVTVETNDRHELLRLQARWLPGDERSFTRVTVENGDQGWHTSVEAAELEPTSQLAGGVIRSSLFAATDAIGLPDSVAVQLAEIFGSDIDFRRDLREGDRFSVVYETLNADGEVMRTGRVLSASFINNGKTFEAVWYEPPGQKGAYYGFDGQSSRKNFLSSPLAFTRVSSGYGMRFHPITGKQKAHLGVDYAAPSGTPVRTIGDGVVSFAGWRNGYGNTIEISHRGNQSTLYAHLSRIGVRQGQKVEQGEFIGAVGSTGLSTGPHLHLEFKVKGVHQDPLEVARKSESVPMQAEWRAGFNAVAALQRAQLDAARSVQQASAE